MNGKRLESELMSSNEPTASAGAAPATLQTRRTGRMIVDGQVHLWKAESEDWKWVPGRPPQLPEPLTIERFLPMMDEAGVDRVVIVPPSWPGDRNDYAFEAVQRFPDRFAVMGRIPVGKPESAALLPTWRDQPGMKGVRLTFHGAQLALLTDGRADWFWPEAEKHNMPVMFFAPRNVSKMLPIAERHPGLPLIIDHMSLHATMAKAGEIPKVIEDVVAFAKFPNVSVKMSSAPNYSLEPYPFKDMDAPLKRCFDAFGPRRCHWGTDLTNSWPKATYKQRVEHFTKELSFLSEEDKDWVMGKSLLEKLKWA